MTEKVIEPEIVHESDSSELVMGGTLVVLLGSAFFIGGTLAVGVMTGIAAAIASGVLLWKCRKYKPRLWNTMMDHPLLTDLGLSAFFILTVAPMTATGLIAGITAAGVATVGIEAAGKYVGKVAGHDSYSLSMPKFKKVEVDDVL